MKQNASTQFAICLMTYEVSLSDVLPTNVATILAFGDMRHYHTTEVQ